MRPTLAFLPGQPYEALLDALAERGHTRADVLASVGLDEAALARGGGYLSLAQMEALVTRGCALEPDIALDVGKRVSLMSHGWLSVAAVTAPTLGAAIGVVAEHFALVSPLFEMNLRTGDDGRMVIRLVSRWPLSPLVERHHTATLAASLYAHVPRALFRGSLPSGLEIDAAALAETRVLRADARVHRAALRRCQSDLDARPDPTRTAAAVRRVLLASGPPFLDLEQTAKGLAVSPRSLRRRLQEESTSYRALLDEVRNSIADEWLEDPRRSITEIGLDLGYTDPANFTRAYRRATGLSPSAARQRHLRCSASQVRTISAS